MPVRRRGDQTFDLTSLDVDIPINRFGDHDPKGTMYALTNRLTAIRDEAKSQKVSVGLRNDPIQALVIRANEGDCVEIRYTDTATGGDYGVHIDGLWLSPGLVTSSFRELAFWTIDDNDKGDYSTLNLRATPFSERLDTAKRFSSYKYSDPNTPLPRMYPNDPLVTRTINVGPSVGTVHLQGAQTLLEPLYTHDGVADGPIIDTIHYGVSETFTLVFNGERPDMRTRPGDYLYNNGDERRTLTPGSSVAPAVPNRHPGLLLP